MPPCRKRGTHWTPGWELSGSSRRAPHQELKSAVTFQCFVESRRGQHNISVTCVTLVGTLNLCINILSPGVTPSLPAEGTGATNPNFRNAYCCPGSTLLLVFLYASLQRKLALLIPFSTLGIYLVMFWKVLRDWITFSCSRMTQSDSRFRWRCLSATFYMGGSNPVCVPLSWKNVQNILCFPLILQNQGVLSFHLTYCIWLPKINWSLSTKWDLSFCSRESIFGDDV